MNVLITGANGYIGARLAVFLLKQGVSVRLGLRDTSKPRAEFEGAQAVMVDLDVAKPLALEEACKDIDTVIHLAALNDQQSRDNPQRAHQINVIGTKLLAEAAHKKNVRQFIYFSTAHVYGSPLQGTYTEDSPTDPKSQYAITHRQAELEVLSSAVRHKTIFRLSNGVGAPILPETNCWMLIVNDLCRQAVTTGKMILKSHGLQLRNFVALEDVEQTVFQSLIRDSQRAASADLYNLVGVTKSIREIAQEIQGLAVRVLGHEPELMIPAATPEEKDLGLKSTLQIHTKSPVYSSEMARLKLKNALEKTLQFCQLNFGGKS